MDPLFIERGFGIGYFVCGLSIFLNPSLWLGWIHQISERQNFLSLGFISIYLGAFMAVNHNIWSLSPSLITTMIAWIAILKGFLYLTYPRLLLAQVKKISFTQNKLRFSGICVMIISVVIIYYSF